MSWTRCGLIVATLTVISTMLPAGAGEGATRSNSDRSTGSRPSGPTKVLILQVSPVQTDQHAARVREVLKSVQGVTDLSFVPLDLGASRVSVTAGQAVTAEALVAALRKGGFTGKLIGDARRDDGRPGEDARPGRLTLFIAPVRSDAEAGRIRQALQQTRGVREVSLRPAERFGTGLATVGLGQDGTAEAVIATLRRLGLGARILEREGDLGAGGRGVDVPLPRNQRSTGGILVLSVSPLTTDAHTNRVRDILMKLDGVREVGFRPAEQQGTMRVTVQTTGPLKADRIEQALRAQGFLVKVLETSANALSREDRLRRPDEDR